MSSTSNTSQTSSNESEENINYEDINFEDIDYENMSETELFMQDLNGPVSQYFMGILRQELEEGSSSNNRRRRKYINRNHETGEDLLMRDYFGDKPMYTDFQFRTRFRMQRHLFLRIVTDLENRYTFFQRRVDATGRAGFSAIVKCTAALRMLAYGCSTDMLDEVLRMGQSTILECLREFVKGIREVYGSTYLRKPDANDLTRLLRIGEARGFPGMLGSIDCIHWEWKNCPVAWQGAYTRGDMGSPSIILEAVASPDLWIWHAFFGVAGSNNDINVLNQSPLFTQQLQGNAPPANFQVNGNHYNLGYYLADGIYPRWATFVKTIPLPQTQKDRLFAMYQEGARKDVERAFGVLQSRFAIVCGPIKIWDTPTISNIMYACIILHNMIVEDERDQYAGNYEYEGLEGVRIPTMEDVNRGAPRAFADVLRVNDDIHNRNIHDQLKQDFVEHIWQKFGSN